MSVEGGGCSGFQYKLDLEEGELSLGAEDVVVEREGARVVVDQTSLEYLQVGPPHRGYFSRHSSSYYQQPASNLRCSQGATVDYHVELIRAGFKITANPQAEGGCSCGASFNIKLEL